MCNGFFSLSPLSRSILLQYYTHGLKFDILICIHRTTLTQIRIKGTKKKNRTCVCISDDDLSLSLSRFLLIRPLFWYLFIWKKKKKFLWVVRFFNIFGINTYVCKRQKLDFLWNHIKPWEGFTLGAISKHKDYSHFSIVFLLI